MAEVAVVKPYEILLRYSCEVGETAGQLRGMSVEQRAFLVDDVGVITARLDRGRADHPKDFPSEELQNRLGADFVTFQQQLVAAQADVEKAKNDLAAAKVNHAESISAVTQERDELRASLSTAVLGKT